MKTLYYLIDTLFNLYLMVVIMRIWLQWVRADFYNPMSQFVVKATHPVLSPLRRIIPSVGGLDLAAVVLAIAVALLKYLTFILLGMIQGSWAGIIVVSLLLVLKQAGSLLFWMLVVRALMSWVSQGRSPIDHVMQQLTEPLLAPIRRFIPPMAGLDLSVLLLFIVLQALNYLLLDLLGPLWGAL